MRTFYIATLGLILSATFGASAQSVPDCPTSNGAYYFQGSKWVSMEPSHSIGFKTTNIAGAAFTYGAAKAHLKAQFRDPRSPYQVDANTVSMCLVGVTDSGRDIVMVKLQEEKDRRELAMASYRVWTGINAQVDPKSVVPVTVEKKAEKVYLVTTKDNIGLGEFMLFTIVPDVASMAKANSPQSLGGYDFGSHQR